MKVLIPRNVANKLDLGLVIHRRESGKDFPKVTTIIQTLGRATNETNGFLLEIIKQETAPSNPRDWNDSGAEFEFFYADSLSDIKEHIV